MLGSPHLLLPCSPTGCSPTSTCHLFSVLTELIFISWQWQVKNGQNPSVDIRCEVRATKKWAQPALLLDSALKWDVIKHSVQTEAGLLPICGEGILPQS